VRAALGGKIPGARTQQPRQEKYGETHPIAELVFWAIIETR